MSPANRARDARRGVIVIQSHSVGGAERYLERLYRELVAEGDQAAVIGELPGWSSEIGKVHDIGLSPKWSRRTIATGVLKVGRESDLVAPLARSLAPSWIHMQFKREQIGFTTALAGIAPVVWTEHGAVSRRSPLRPLYARAARGAAAVICVSDEVAESIEGLVPRSKIHVIENAVDTTAQAPTDAAGRARARASFGLRDGGRVVLWIGRLDEGKRPQLALRYARSAPEDQVLVVGSGTESARIAAEAEGLANVTVVGHLTDVGPAFHAADVVMFTSTGKGEGMPTVIVEAAAYDRPTVTHAGSGAESFVRASGGVIVAAAEDMTEWSRAFAASVQRDAAARVDWLSRHDLSSWVAAHQRVIDAVL